MHVVVTVLCRSDGKPQYFITDIIFRIMKMFHGLDQCQCKRFANIASGDMSL